MSDSKCGIIELDSEAGSVIKEHPANDKIPFYAKDNTNIEQNMITPNPYGLTPEYPSMYANKLEAPLMVSDFHDDYPEILYKTKNTQ